MRGFQLVRMLDGYYYLEIDGDNITDILYRSKPNGAQEALTLILDEIDHHKMLTEEKIKEIAEKLKTKLKYPSIFKHEYSENHLKSKIRIYQEAKEDSYNNLSARSDWRFLQARYGMDKDWIDEYIKDYCKIKDFHWDLVGRLQEQDELNFMDGECIIGKSFRFKSEIRCFNDPIAKEEKISVFIQFVIGSAAMGLQDLESNHLRQFVQKHMSKIEFPWNYYSFWKLRATMFGELSLQQLNDMNAELEAYGILDGYTKVESGYMIIPNFITEAVKMKEVKYEFGLRLHVGLKTEEQFEFFIQN